MISAAFTALLILYPSLMKGLHSFCMERLWLRMDEWAHIGPMRVHTALLRFMGQFANLIEKRKGPWRLG